ncbi:MAG: hypothetical protein Q8K63_14035 [Acidimicrobiales bacterium]|nr:hypothetical protein [Acidimicrobiales bacterium]
MLRRLIVVTLASVLVAACGGNGSGSDERKVLVDYESEEFAMFVAANFPQKVQALPGQTILFEQQWTGEPHTITSGKQISADLEKGSAWFELFNGYGELQTTNDDLVNPEDPGDATFADFVAQLKAAKPAAARDNVLDAYRSLMKTFAELPDIDSPPPLPFSEVNDLIDELSGQSFENLLFVGDDIGDIQQNTGQACYLKSGLPPEDGSTRCSRAQQQQPEFDGTYSFYNSGILPYEGPRGNSYPMKLADDIKPGKYFFYCAVHGPSQLSEIQVLKPGSEVPTAREVAQKGRDDAEEFILPLDKLYRETVKTNTFDLDGETLKGPFGGLPSNGLFGSINEFVPRTIRAKVNETITWKFMGSDHTVSFDVPAYLPIIEFTPNRIRLNPKVKDVAGGSPALTEPVDGEVYAVDGGTYDGEGFFSSGLFGHEPYATYSLKISKRGTYNYACLVHPKMIGKVIIT